MSRKNYEKFASILAGEWACATPQGKAALYRFTLSIADYFKQDNSRFDRVRFYWAVFGSGHHVASKECDFVNGHTEFAIK